MTPAFPQVVVPVHLDARDAPVLSAVDALASRGLVGAVHLLHVAEVGRTWLGRAPTVPPRPPALDALVAAVDRRHSATAVKAAYSAGRTVDVVARYAADVGADLLVVGRPEAPPDGAGWTELGLRLLRLVDAPVLVVPDRVPPGLVRAVVGMDLSDSALLALEVAAGAFPDTRAVAVLDASAEGGEAARTSTLEAYAQAVRLDPRPPLELVDGRSPTEVLLAQDADVVVIGSRGLTPVAAVLLGSTAERLGSVCVRPVLVVRRKGEHRGLFQTLFRGPG